MPLPPTLWFFSPFLENRISRPGQEQSKEQQPVFWPYRTKLSYFIPLKVDVPPSYCSSFLSMRQHWLHIFRLAYDAYALSGRDFQKQTNTHNITPFRFASLLALLWQRLFLFAACLLASAKVFGEHSLFLAGNKVGHSILYVPLPSSPRLPPHHLPSPTPQYYILQHLLRIRAGGGREEFLTTRQDKVDIRNWTENM